MADTLGIAYQQVAKLETAATRASGSRLWDLASALDVPVSFFFDGAPSAGAAVRVDGHRGPGRLEWTRAFDRLAPDVRGAILGLVRSVGGDGQIQAAG